MLMAHQLRMTDGQYVYVIADQPTQNIRTPWVADNDQDETARLAFESVLQVRVSLQIYWSHTSMQILKPRLYYFDLLWSCCSQQIELVELGLMH